MTWHGYENLQRAKAGRGRYAACPTTQHLPPRVNPQSEPLGRYAGPRGFATCSTSRTRRGQHLRNARRGTQSLTFRKTPKGVLRAASHIRHDGSLNRSSSSCLLPPCIFPVSRFASATNPGASRLVRRSAFFPVASSIPVACPRSCAFPG